MPLQSLSCAAVCRYAEAAQLRDQLRKMQEAANEAADREMLDRRRLAATRRLKLGQRVQHASQGFKGLVCGCVPV